MIEFYGFHDSYLERIEHLDQTVVLRITAYRYTWPDGMDVDTGTGWTQPIEITISDAVIENEIKDLPVRFIGGELKAENLWPNPEENHSDVIPSSFFNVADVEMVLECIEETTSDYNIMCIKGKSATLSYRGEAAFVEKLRL